MMPLAAVANFGVLESLIDPADPTGTAARVLDSPGSLRLAVLCLLGVVVLDVIVAAALWRWLRPAHPLDAAVAGLLRACYAAAFLTATTHLLAGLHLLEDSAYGALALEERAVLAAAEFAAFDTGWSVALGVFGAHLIVLGALIWASPQAPRWLGALVALAGLGYAVDTVLAILSPEPVFELGTVTFVGEVLLAGWLLWAGWRSREGGRVASRQPQAWATP